MATSIPPTLAQSGGVLTIPRPHDRPTAPSKKAVASGYRLISRSETDPPIPPALVGWRVSRNLNLLPYVSIILARHHTAMALDQLRAVSGGYAVVCHYRYYA